ncbi:MAG: hypothetical protein M1832_002738 [Thelocarpon impressellum]|nr:MAG: hypothetical protein M1832_002738 [Thelocarpon impressellum]
MPRWPARSSAACLRVVLAVVLAVVAAVAAVACSVQGVLAGRGRRRLGGAAPRARAQASAYARRRLWHASSEIRQARGARGAAHPPDWDERETRRQPARLSRSAIEPGPEQEAESQHRPIPAPRFPPPTLRRRSPPRSGGRDYWGRASFGASWD